MTIYDLNGGGAHALIGGQYADQDLSLTASAATTDGANMRGMVLGTLLNESGGQIVITYYGTKHKDDTPRAIKDEDGVAVTQTIADNTMVALPAACGGVAYLFPVLSAATATVSLHVER